jgi:hypothetical protein
VSPFEKHGCCSQRPQSTSAVVSTHIALVPRTYRMSHPSDFLLWSWLISQIWGSASWSWFSSIFIIHITPNWFKHLTFLNFSFLISFGDISIYFIWFYVYGTVIFRNGTFVGTTVWLPLFNGILPDNGGTAHLMTKPWYDITHCVWTAGSTGNLLAMGILIIGIFKTISSNMGFWILFKLDLWSSV